MQNLIFWDKFLDEIDRKSNRKVMPVILFQLHGRNEKFWPAWNKIDNYAPNTRIVQVRIQDIPSIPTDTISSDKNSLLKPFLTIPSFPLPLPTWAWFIILIGLKPILPSFSSLHIDSHATRWYFILSSLRCQRKSCCNRSIREATSTWHLKIENGVYRNPYMRGHLHLSGHSCA